MQEDRNLKKRTFIPWRDKVFHLWYKTTGSYTNKIFKRQNKIVWKLKITKTFKI